jgi:hypothetical protein
VSVRKQQGCETPADAAPRRLQHPLREDGRALFPATLKGARDERIEACERIPHVSKTRRCVCVLIRLRRGHVAIQGGAIEQGLPVQRAKLGTPIADWEDR